MFFEKKLSNFTVCTMDCPLYLKPLRHCIGHLGGGSSNWPTLFCNIYHGQSRWIFFYFSYLSFWPLLLESRQKMTLNGCLWQFFLMHNLFLIWKWGCLQKNKDWYMKKLPSYSHFKLKQWNYQNFSKHFLADKNCDSPANFQNIAQRYLEVT